MFIMTIKELIRELQYIEEDFGDLEVRVAYQPSWPLAGKIENVWMPEEDEDGNQKVWLAVDSVGHAESPYAPKDAWG